MNTRHNSASAEKTQDVVRTPPALRTIKLNTEKFTYWDAGLLIFVKRLRTLSLGTAVAVDTGGLPPGAQQLLELTAAVPDKTDAHTTPQIDVATW